MKKQMVVCVLILTLSNMVLADTFGTGENQFTIDFVNISGATNPTSGYGIVSNDYRMGIYEITNGQWDKFKASIGVPVTGSLSDAYDENPTWTGTNIPTNKVSWYEAAQFVNWLNTSTNHQPAYKFTGTQGASDYTFVPWQSGDAGYDSSNPFRNSNAYYFLPTENEWVKAGYWNGTTLQTYATVGDVVPVAGVDTNYNFVFSQPWNVGDGSEELNGTYDMMGNVWEWTESPYKSGNYLSESLRTRGLRGGSRYYDSYYFSSSVRLGSYPNMEDGDYGFRVASVPEPCSMVLLAIGGLILPHRIRLNNVSDAKNLD